MAIQSQEVFEKFKALVSQAESWKSLADAQFVSHLAIFLQWAIEDAAFKNERARHEAFLDSALNRSSILAHGEGMEYMPRKPIAPTGKATFTNTGENPFTLLRNREFQSTTQEVYTLEETIVVEPRASVEATVTQRSREVVTFTIEEEKPFYEYLFGRDISPNIVGFKVFVAEDGENYVEWQYSRELHNAYSTSLVYDEYYHFTDQIGIRFGNGDFGKIPPQGSKVQVELVLTEGDTILLEKQPLYPMEEITDSLGLVGSVQAAISETVQHGKAQEGTEEMRRNLHYASVYNERLVWDNDYKYFLRRRYPDIVFAVAWGEEEAEKMWGANVEWINRIWLCAYSPSRDMKDLVLEAVREVPFLCRNFEWHDPEHVFFTVQITGKVLKDCVISEVLEAITTNLTLAYGRDSSERRETVYLHEIYDLVYATGFFDATTGAWFEVVLSGQTRAEFIYQMVSVDLEHSTLDISYRN
ncbi:MAG: hypothetical protein IJU76_14250 [Desulfovibrionaceae bacterium]|nr:hypothetical protein [Desulfovibrionaceae bacterium]